MRRLAPGPVAATLAALMMAAFSASAGADDNRASQRFFVELSGFSEVHGPSLGIGALFSTGKGRLHLRLDPKMREIDYVLVYDFPDATAPLGTQFVNQAHLHFGQNHTTGGINVWLCQSPDNPAPAAVSDTPVCPSPSGKVMGTILPRHVLALAGQGFPAGEDGFDALVKALRDKAIYGNVHTDRFPPGEIRGQLDDFKPH